MQWLGDVRHGFRTLLQNPGFTAVAVLMLALGIGINAAVFTVTNAVLFKGFPMVERTDRLRYIGYTSSNCCVAYPDFLDWRAQSKSFSGMAIVHGVGFIFSDGDGFTENVVSNENSADTFRLVGRKPILGRDFTAADEAPGSERVAILNYRFWERRYGKDRMVIGRSVRLNGLPTTLIGVMPQDFSFPQVVDLWVPLVRTAEVMKRENRDTWMVIGRLADGVTMATAQAEMSIIGKQLAAEYPATNYDRVPLVQNFTDFFLGSNAAVMYSAMWGAVGFVLLIACANLANLMLARAIGRSREISVRIALGAGRWQIVRRLLIESVMLSGLGGFCGWWLARLAVRAYELAMVAKASWLVIDYTMDSRVLGYLIAISIGTGVLFGLAPALRLSRLDVNAALKDGGRSATGGARGKHLSSLLVTAEMALAVMLLAGAGVMIRSFLKIHNADMGVNAENVLITSLGLPRERYPGPEARSSFFDRVQARLQAIRGVESLTLSDSLPSSGTRRLAYEISGVRSGAYEPDDRRRPKLAVTAISPSYFRTLGAAVRAGREFNDFDASSTMPVAIVNQKFADNFWPGEDPLGKRLRIFKDKEKTPGAWLTVVGVASNIVQNDDTRQRFDPVVYLPRLQDPRQSMWIIARTRVPPANLANVFRQEFHALDPELPLYGPFDMRDRLERYWDSRFYGWVFVIFAVIALLLASVGLYAVTAHSVSQRTQEMGIRLALGATSGDVLKLVFVQGMIPLGIGLAIGLAGSLAVNRLLQSALVQVSPADPITLAIASVVMISAAALGCLIPGRRAMRVDPVIALKYE